MGFVPIASFTEADVFVTDENVRVEGYNRPSFEYDAVFLSSHQVLAHGELAIVGLAVLVMACHVLLGVCLLSEVMMNREEAGFLIAMILAMGTLVLLTFL